MQTIQQQLSQEIQADLTIDFLYFRQTAEFPHQVRSATDYDDLLDFE